MDSNEYLRARRGLERQQRALNEQNLSFPCVIASPYLVFNQPASNPPVSGQGQEPIHLVSTSLILQQQQSFVPLLSPSFQLQSSELVDQRTPSTSAATPRQFNPNERRGGFRMLDRESRTTATNAHSHFLMDEDLLGEDTFDYEPASYSSPLTAEREASFFLNDDPRDPRPSDRFFNSFERTYLQLCLDLNLTEHAASQILNFIKTCDIKQARVLKT